MNVLVTGGLGFFGLHLVQTLAGKNNRVIAADILEVDPAIQSFLAPVAENITFQPLDVRDRTAFEKVIDEEAIQVIIHAAALTPDPLDEQSHMDRILDVNLGGTINAILAAADAPRVDRLLVMSSSGVYGASQPTGPALQDESGPLDLEGLYGITKYSSELIMQRCASLSHKRMAALRLAAVYGEMERPTGSRNHMSQIHRLEKALRDGRKVRLAGKDVCRDWLYAGDAAEAVWSLLQAPRWNWPVYNLGSQTGLSFRKVVEIFSHHGLQYEWVPEFEAEIAMHPAQARAPLEISRLIKDSGFCLPLSAADRLEEYVKRL